MCNGQCEQILLPYLLPYVIQNKAKKDHASQTRGRQKRPNTQRLTIMTKQRKVVIIEWHSRGQRFDPACLHQVIMRLSEKSDDRFLF